MYSYFFVPNMSEFFNLSYTEAQINCKPEQRETEDLCTHTKLISQSFSQRREKDLLVKRKKNETEKNDNVERYWVLLHTFVSL